MKKIILLTILVFCAGMIVGLNCKRTFIKNDNLDDYMVGILPGEMITDIISQTDGEIEKCEDIYTVKCISEPSFLSGRLLWEVEIVSVHEGKEKEGNRIYICPKNSFSYIIEDNIYGMNMGFVSGMQKEEEYLVFLGDEISLFDYNINIYETLDSPLTTIFLKRDAQSQPCTSLFEDYSYNYYGDIKENEFFISTNEGIKKMIKFKGHLLDSYG